jgi:Glycosyl transferase family 2
VAQATHLPIIVNSLFMSIAVLIVHYRTFTLTQQALWSFYEAYPQTPLYVVENASGDGSLAQLIALQSAIPTLHILPQSQNLHHGPGMDIGIRAIDATHILLLDSDCILYKTGLLEALSDLVQQNAPYLIGKMHQVDKDGFDTPNGEISYIHPHCALVDKAQYVQLPPFQKHGAPCLSNQISAAATSFLLQDFPVSNFVYHIGRGTVRSEGYGLGFKDKVKMLWIKCKRLFG